MIFTQEEIMNKRKRLVEDAVYHMQLINSELYESIKNTDGFNYWFNKLTNIASLTDEELE